MAYGKEFIASTQNFNIIYLLFIYYYYYLNSGHGMTAALLLARFPS